MAKRVMICDELGNVIRTISARHNDAAEEREHAHAFAHDNIALLQAEFPGKAFHAFEVTTRRGEDEATLHGQLHRLRAELKPDGAGGIECLDVAFAVDDPLERDGRLVFPTGYGYTICTSKPERVDPDIARAASARRKARAVAAGMHADFTHADLLQQLRGPKR